MDVVVAVAGNIVVYHDANIVDIIHRVGVFGKVGEGNGGLDGREVDLINLVSLRTGYSIGGFDADKIVGTELCLGIGQSGEPFEGIGRGPLNIECMPVVRDAIGGIGTPTSDHERTKMNLDTTHILVIINGYSGSEGLQEAAEMTAKLLESYASATDCQSWVFE